MISDTHELHNRLTLPEADVLIHAGDATAHGGRAAIERFLGWMEYQPHQYKVLVAGNHDFYFESNPVMAKELLKTVAPSVIYLQDRSVEIEGLKFYGAPWTPRFFDWAFNLDRGLPLQKKWQQIPDDVDVLITHGPPMGVLDMTPRGNHIGCEALRERLLYTKPKLHVFGHCHHSSGYTLVEQTLFVNAAICNEAYNPVNPPRVAEINVAAQMTTFN